MAEGVFRQVLQSSERPLTDVKFNVDSAGTSGFHSGDAPHPRTLSTLKRHGVTDYHHRSRQVTQDDFKEFDYLFAMDRYNFSDLQSMRKKLSKKTGQEGKLAEVFLFGDFECDDGGVMNTANGRDVPDPYYLPGEAGFEEVYHLVTKFSSGFLKYLEAQQPQN